MKIMREGIELFKIIEGKEKKANEKKGEEKIFLRKQH